ncbi:MAG: glucokinase [Parvibaculaceae bacterium]|nr:glucokinase [Parvibaculaceae bacterium]
MRGTVLVGDVGGTNTRFALASRTNGRIELRHAAAWMTVLHPDLPTAIRTYLAQAGNPDLAGAAMCAAGPVLGEGGDAHVLLTNCAWDVSVSTIADATGVGSPLLLNDFSAIAWSIPALSPDDTVQIGPGRARPGQPIGVLGAGTGLGVATLVPVDDDFIVLPGEGGHVDLAATSPREISLIYQLMQEYGHVSAERVLSGPGLEALYMAIGAIDGASGDTMAKGRPAALDIANRARAGTCPISVEAVHLFCGWLGAFAGNLALTIGAGGGIYVAGGIVPGWGDLFEAAYFRHRFEAKGRFKAYLENIPTFVVRRDNPALLGLAHAAARHQRQIG